MTDDKAVAVLYDLTGRLIWAGYSGDQIRELLTRALFLHESKRMEDSGPLVRLIHEAAASARENEVPPSPASIERALAWARYLTATIGAEEVAAHLPLVVFDLYEGDAQFEWYAMGAEGVCTRSLIVFCDKDGPWDSGLYRTPVEGRRITLDAPDDLRAIWAWLWEPSGNADPR